MPKPKRLSYAAKAEMLAATFHLLTDHMPKVWKTVPAWLRSQIKQVMLDCSTEYKDFTEKDLKDCNDYGQWLSEKYPQPGSTLDALLKKKKRDAGKTTDTGPVPRTSVRPR
jgi:hypothetical protein